VQAVGIDIVEVERFGKIVNRWGDRFLSRVLTKNEIAYCRRKASAIESMAARFAAKEAFIKCIPSNTLAYFPWKQMEILNQEDGKPYVALHGELYRLFRDKEILVSLSHTKTSAIAIIIVQNERGRKI